MSQKVVENDVFNDEVDPNNEQQTQQTQQSQQPTQQQQTPSPSDDVKKAVAEAFKEFAPKQQQPEQKKEMTEEEKRKFWAIFNPEEADPRFFHKFFGLGEDTDEMTLKEKKALFGMLQNGLGRQFATMFKNMMDARMAELDQRLNPLQEHFAQARAQTIRQNFNAAYPQLADKKFDSILKLSANALRDQEFDSEESYFKALADNAVEAIRSTGVEFSLDSTTTSKPAPGTAPKTSRSRVGGTGGTGGGAPEVKKSRDDSDSIF